MSRICCCFLLCAALAASAAAQQKEPVGPFVVDVRGAFARHKATLAPELSVDPANLPTRTLGLAAGAHVYPLRSRRVSLGLGGNFVMTRGSRTIDQLAADGKTLTKSPTVRRRFRTFAPEISLNFGHRNGWSYISGGMFGRSQLYLERADAAVASAPYRRTLNYGGGARWFTREHLAFSVDFRWYSLAEQPAGAAAAPVQARTTLLVLSGGISIR